jgi:protein ImuB
MFCCLRRDPASAPGPGTIEAVARACSPRVEPRGEAAALFDASGLAPILGSPDTIAHEVRRLAARRGLIVHVALAPTWTAAWLLAHARTGETVVTADAAAALAGLPLAIASTLGASDECVLEIGARWGLRTLGDLARLPRADVHARLGAQGVRWHQAACGEDADPFAPVDEAARFSERFDPDWPIDGLEPLSVVVSRLCDGLAVALERADRGAIAVTTTLGLVTRAAHVRTLQLPAPMRDARVLRTLILLDCESHPPDAAIDVVEVAVETAPGLVLQGSLLARTLPSPEDLATLTARLGALAGEGRVGAPALADSHDERAFGMVPFALRPSSSRPSSRSLPSALCPLPCFRRFRPPIAARVVVEHGRPVRVQPAARELPGGSVAACAGPWRNSGRWWALDHSRWDRDGWDVELAGGVYRLARDRATGGWVVEGIVD